MNNQKLWQIALAELELNLSPSNFKAWFPQTKILKNENGLIEIGCPTSYIRERLEQRHYKQTKEILDRLTQAETEIIFTVSAGSKPLTEPPGPLFTRQQKTSKQGLGLFPNYTFDNFIVGNNNNLAHAVAHAVVDRPGVAYNPFFLYSGVGLGKTHLIQAIGNETLKKHPSSSVLYCTGESFTNELIDSIQSGSRKNTAKFRNKFRSIDVLLIDDVQFIAGRERTQEEFFHTFNALHMAKKQVVLTSDKPPKEIAKLEERLSSRFAGGMIADMQTPDLDMRVAILRNKAKDLKISIPDEVINILAEGVTTNIRELEGTFHQVITRAKTEKRAITLEIVKKVLGENFLSSEKTVTPKRIIQEVCAYYTVSQKDIKGARRLKEIARPRQITMYLLRSLTDLSLVEIGQLLGGRDHTTVIHGEQKVQNLIEDNSQIREQINVIKSQICG